MTVLLAAIAAALPAPVTPAPAPAEPAVRPRPALTYSRHNRRRARRQLEAAHWYLRRHRATRPYRGWLASVRYCESHGNYATNTGNGFFGAYQFTLSTWWSVGGRGYPHLAPPLEQDYRAVRLLVTGGSGHWPVCG